MNVTWEVKIKPVPGLRTSRVFHEETGADKSCVVRAAQLANLKVVQWQGEARQGWRVPHHTHTRHSLPANSPTIKVGAHFHTQFDTVLRPSIIPFKLQ